MAIKTDTNEHRYGIGAVAKLTGLTDHTIRVWERRYSAVVAQRTANGRRLYAPADVEKLGLLKRLTDQGLSIGQIASESLPALRERTRDMRELVATPLPDHVRVAILGDFLPKQFAVHERDLAPVEILVADNNPDRLIADLERQPVDVVVMENPVLDAKVVDQLREILKRSDTPRGVIVYSFGRARDIDKALDAQILALRSPVSVDEAREAVMRAFKPARPARASAKSKPKSPTSEWQFVGKVEPRRFDNAQLATLAQASTAIDCECPHHLAQLVVDLSAFEVYSANCANRDEDDAALHRYLHETTAQARNLIEIALERVAEAEGIDY